MRREDTREGFLTQFWTPYPAAPLGCCSVDRWQKTTGWVGGILSWSSAGAAEGGDLILLSATGSMPIKWDLPYLFVKSAEDSGQPLAQLSISHILQPGDQIAVFVSKEHRASKLMLLAPALRERPVLRQSRHIREWPNFLQQVRDFFKQSGYFELTTPSLVKCPGLEPTLEPFKVDNLFLPTSPEIHLKKALSLGFNDIFEIKLCYRKNEFSEQHQPEFHMLEWYRTYSDLSFIQADLQNLLRALGEETKLLVTTFAELFKKHLQFTLTPETSLADLRGLAADLKIDILADASWNDTFHHIFVAQIEPHLANCPPTILKDFPPSMAALARLTSDGWADRFEFYWRGFEIANAFHEVNDPREQELRWQGELAERKLLGTSEVPADLDLIEHLKMAMPPTGGIALGLERLFMAVHGISDIRATRLFHSQLQ